MNDLEARELARFDETMTRAKGLVEDLFFTPSRAGFAHSRVDFGTEPEAINRVAHPNRPVLATTRSDCDDISV
jgi:hypothetical protein